MLLLYKSYNYISKQKLFLKLSRGSWVEGRGGRGGRGGFRDTPLPRQRAVSAHTSRDFATGVNMKLSNSLIVYQLWLCLHHGYGSVFLICFTTQKTRDIEPMVV